MKLGKLFPKDFLAAVAGASVMGITEAALEVYSPELFGQPTRISATNPPLGVEPLLPIEKWVIVPVGGVVGLLTKRSRKTNIRAFGNGAWIYVAPRIVSREIVRTKQAADRNWAPPV